MGNPVTLPELEKALDDLIMQDAPPMLEETDLTIALVASRAKCGNNKAERMLEKWVLEGKVEYLGERRREDGHKTRAWRLK